MYEKWFAKEPGLTQVSVNNSIQESMGGLVAHYFDGGLLSR
jgi:hypothetical protein